MAKLKKGHNLVCIPCGRRVVIDACGVSRTTLWCCGRPMQKKIKAKITQKTSKNRKARKKK